MKRQQPVGNAALPVLYRVILIMALGSMSSVAFAAPGTKPDNVCLNSRTSLWITEGNKRIRYLQFYGDGQYAVFSLPNALEERTKRRAACALSERGDLLLPLIHRKNSWELLNGAVLQGFSLMPVYRDGQRVAGEFERRKETIISVRRRTQNEWNTGV